MTKLRTKKITAAALLVAGSVLTGMLTFASASARAEELKILTWEGYADDQWVAEFEKETGATVKVSYTGSVDEIFAKMEGSKGADFDVVAIETSSYKRLYEQKLIQPLDLSKLPNYQNLSPVFQKIDAITFDGKPYAAPYA
jgi:spermidine/putrescine-binding protein